MREAWAAGPKAPAWGKVLALDSERGLDSAQDLDSATDLAPDPWLANRSDWLPSGFEEPRRRK